MNITTIFITSPSTRLAQGAMSFSDPFTDATGKKMIDHTLSLVETTHLHIPFESEGEWADVGQLWEAVDAYFENTGFELHVVDSEVQA